MQQSVAMPDPLFRTVFHDSELLEKKKEKERETHQQRHL